LSIKLILFKKKELEFSDGVSTINVINGKIEPILNISRNVEQKTKNMTK
jgi:hypothetical protein